MVDAAQNFEEASMIDNNPMLLSSHCLPIPATFRFNSFDTIFDAAIRRSPEGGAQMVVLGRLGELPFSVESRDIRRQLGRIVDASSQIPYADISLDRSQSIVVRGQIAFNGIPSPAMVAAGATVISVALKPICDLVNSCREPEAATA
jgi:hypothetical protein